MNITLETGNTRIYIWLNNTQAAKELAEKLPLEFKANLWEGEVYFYMKQRLTPDKEAKREVRVGDVAYWHEGPGIRIFHGKTASSTDGRPKANSPVTIIGNVVSNIEDLKKIENKDRIIIKG